MKRSKTPRLVVHPRPTPWADPIPVARAVRSPAGGNFVRIPNVTILGLFAPRAMIIKIAVADHVTRNVSRGNGIVFLPVALAGPSIKSVGAGGSFDVVFDIVTVRACELCALTSVDVVGLAAGSDFAFTADDRHARRFAAFIDIDAKRARLLDNECKARGVHLVQITFAQFSYTEIDAAFGEAHLRDVFIQVQKG